MSLLLLFNDQISNPAKNYGLQIVNGSNQARLTADDYVHRLVQSGTFTMPAGSNPSANVSVTGMTDSDEWFVVVSGEVIATPGTNQFTARSYLSWTSQSVSYSVYRR